MSSDDDDKLLRELGRAVHAEERTPLQAQLDRLSAGQLSAGELTRLDTQSRSDAELARALQAYAPITASVKAQIAARAVAAARARRRSSDDVRDEEPDADGIVAPVSLAAHRARRMRALWTAVPLVAAAAAAMLWLARADKQVAPLPEYVAQVAGAAASVRAAPAPAPEGGVSSEELAPVRVAPDTRLKIALRPATNAGASVQARVYLITSAGVRIWPSEMVQADSGAVQLLLAPVPAVIDSPAAAAIIVARGDVLAKRGEELVRVPQARGPGYQRWRLPLLPVLAVMPSDTKE